MKFDEYFEERITQIERIPHRGNNVLHKVKTEKGVYLIKAYSTHQKDGWCRDKTDFKSVSILHNERFPVPKPIMFDEKSHIGIYSFEKGKTLSPAEVQAFDMQKMAEFIAQMHSLPLETKRLFDAERTQCLSIKDYIALIKKRYCLLEEDFTGNDKLRTFLLKDVRKRIEEVSLEVLKKEDFPNKELPLEEQVITPGDFGFHNALVHRGRYVFIDFEYCGRDDPVKQVLDFLHHDKTRELSNDLKQIFLEDYLKRTNADDRFKKRLKLVDPLIGLNWTLIYLNVLSKGYQEHLAFSGQDIGQTVAERVTKAEQKLEDLHFFKD